MRADRGPRPGTISIRDGRTEHVISLKEAEILSEQLANAIIAEIGETVEGIRECRRLLGELSPYKLDAKPE